MKIEGAQAVSPEAIRLALGRNFPCLIAAHPKRPLQDLPKTVRDQMLLGYRHAGYAEAKIDVTIDKTSQRLLATISEGPCFLAGEVRLEGAKRLEAAKFVERLTKPHPPELAAAGKNGQGDACWLDPSGNLLELLPAVWPSGKPAPLEGVGGQETPWGEKLSEKQMPALYFAVEKALRSLGFYFPQFALRIDLDRAKSEARLTVILEDEGPEPIVAAVSTEGNARNSREEILRYLQITPGMLLTREELSRIRTRLWSSGRFARCEAAPAPDASRKLALLIEVVEYPKAPRLSEGLSPADEAILRLRNWLARSESWQGDLVVSYRQGRSVFDAVVAPAQGALFHVKDPKAEFLGVPLTLAAVASRDELGVYSGARKLTFQPSHSGLVAALGMRLTDDFLAEADQPFLLTFGLGCEPIGKDAKTPPFRVALDLQPSAFLAHLREHAAKTIIADGVLSVASADSTSRTLLRVEENTGKLLEFLIFDLAADCEAQSPWSVRIRVAPGEYDARLTALRKETRDSPNSFQSERPASSALAFLTRQPWLAEPLSKRLDAPSLPAACRTMLELGVAAPLDEHLLALRASRGEFLIPLPATREGSSQSLQEIVGAYCLAFDNAMFPAGSWPWTLAAQWLGLAIGLPQTEELDPDALLRDGGPLALGLTAGAFEPFGDGIAGPIAAEGLSRLQEKGFCTDCEPFFDRGTLAGKCLRRAAEILRGMEDDDFARLSRDLPSDAAEALRGIRQTLRDAADKPVDETLRELVPQLWKAGADKWIESQLRDIQDRNTSGERQPIAAR